MSAILTIARENRINALLWVAERNNAPVEIEERSRPSLRESRRAHLSVVETKSALEAAFAA